MGTPVISTNEVLEWAGFGLDPEQNNLIWREIEKSFFFWSSLPPLVSPEVFRQIHLMTRRHHVVFVTNRLVGEAPQRQTHLWLRTHGVDYPSVILAAHKGEVASVIRADFSIEDKPENATAIAEWTKSYLIDRPYNQTEVEGNVIRVQTVSEFLEAVNGEV